MYPRGGASWVPPSVKMGGLSSLSSWVLHEFAWVPRWVPMSSPWVPLSPSLSPPEFPWVPLSSSRDLYFCKVFFRIFSKRIYFSPVMKFYFFLSWSPSTWVPWVPNLAFPLSSPGCLSSERCLMSPTNEENKFGGFLHKIHKIKTRLYYLNEF